MRSYGSTSLHGTLSTTQKSQNQFQNNCKRVTLDIIPIMLPFFTSFEVDVDKHTLKPYMASVNHNVINEITWLNIVHTLVRNFVSKVTAKTTQRQWKTWVMMLVL
jgi:hypothetical protein